jgi:hypothetical protein
VTYKLSNFKQHLLAAGGLDSDKPGLITYTMMAKIAPWWLAAGTNLWLKYRDSNRRKAPPTFTPSTAGPLCGIAKRKNE